MAWEWVAPVSAASGASIGAITTWLAGRGARKDAAKLAKVERRQQRFADAYVELLELVEFFGQWAQTVQPMIDFGQPKQPLPTPEQQARVRALVAAYGSPEVKKLYETYQDLIGSILNTAWKIDQARKEGSAFAEEEPDVWRKLGLELKPAEARARRKLGEQVATELSG